MFKVVLKKWLHASCSTAGPNDRVLEAEFELPFAPFVGLKIVKGDYEYEFKSVYWYADKNLFKCYDQDDKTYYDVGIGLGMWNATKQQMDELVQKYTEGGAWKEAA